jgi:rare lipoprotein A
MRILSENTILDAPRAPFSARRVFFITAGLLCGIALSLHSIRPNHPACSVLAESETLPAPSLSSGKASSPSTTPKKHEDWHQIGLASWYGSQFQGKQTADGESFNMHDLTCAHRSLPLGTWVKVTNLHTRKWIVVRVNDRGPVPDTRIADLSSEAAHMLGMRGRGVTRVRLDVIDPKAAVEIARLDRIRTARLAAEQSAMDAGD